MSKKIKILIVDDSAIYRTQIKAALSSISQVEVVASSSNGRLALDRMTISPVDLVILDLEMPIMDGITTLKEMKNLDMRPEVIVFSSISKRGAEITMEALTLGASDFVTKPDGKSDEQSPQEKIKSLLFPKLQGLFPEHFNISSPISIESPSINPISKISWDRFKPQVIVIGSSTGGPATLEKIFSQLKGPFSCPIIIAQHMPPLFTATLIQRLGKLCGVPASEAVHGEDLKDNHIYIAPGNYHLRLKREGTQVKCLLDQDEQINFVRPAVDPLFETAAHIYGNRCLSIVLTGMGQDGRQGVDKIKEHGGAVIIQDKKSCVVFGMPGAIFQKGTYDLIQTPDEIASILKEKIEHIQLGQAS